MKDIREHAGYVSMTLCRTTVWDKRGDKYGQILRPPRGALTLAEAPKEDLKCSSALALLY